ncbi:MAG: hypothetical protein BGO59_22625 [Spirosoma sp. 48-14]|nr:MAG: hypothetical protein BGO59_22625 [Spirosoma sp. 48-14]
MTSGKASVQDLLGIAWNCLNLFGFRLIPIFPPLNPCRNGYTFSKMKVATLSRKEVKIRLHVSDYILNKLLRDAKCDVVLQRPEQRIFPVSAWKNLFDHCGVDIHEKVH